MANWLLCEFRLRPTRRGMENWEPRIENGEPANSSVALSGSEFSIPGSPFSILRKALRDHDKKGASPFSEVRPSAGNTPRSQPGYGTQSGSLPQSLAAAAWRTL